MKKAESMMKKVLYLLAAVLMMFAFTACDDDNEDAGGKGLMQDPYAAYGLESGKGSLEEAMMEKPPAAILLKPTFYYRAHYGTVPQGGEITLEKGKSANLSLDLELVHDSGQTATVKSDITLKYDGKKGEDLFHADTSTYGNPTLYIDGKYVSEYGDHVVQDKPARFYHMTNENPYGYSYSGPGEEFLYIVLHVDKGKATKADGNIGFLYLRIIGVKR